MAFSASTSYVTIIGNLRLVTGTFTNTDTDSGGDITTGLSVVRSFNIVPTSHVGANNPKYSASNGTVTIVTDNGVDGTWTAIGS